jgi:hypothetical protein
MNLYFFTDLEGIGKYDWGMGGKAEGYSAYLASL